MDKKKVKVHIQNVSKMLGTKRQTLSAGTIEHIQNELTLALRELSKSDWVSVEDELPPYEEEVWVTSKKNPSSVYKDRRAECTTVRKDSNDFILTWEVRTAPITHWKPIEKL